MHRFPRLAISLAVTAMAAMPLSAELKVGDQAPDFTLPATDGSAAALADYEGKNHVVLAFFPKAFTAG